MYHTLKSAIFVAALLIPANVQADEAEDLAQMSKSRFLAVAETLMLEGMEAQAEMLRRFKPDAVPDSLTAPLSEAERTAMACTWDGMNDKGLLVDYAKQALLIKKMTRLVEEDPAFDYVDLMGNPDVLVQTSDEISDEVFTVMNDCGTIEASKQRSRFMFDLLPLITEEMKARGYLN